jgi:hypothetical protein
VAAIGVTQFRRWSCVSLPWVAPLPECARSGRYARRIRPRAGSALLPAPPTRCELAYRTALLPSRVFRIGQAALDGLHLRSTGRCRRGAAGRFAERSSGVAAALVTGGTTGTTVPCASRTCTNHAQCCQLRTALRAWGVGTPPRCAGDERWVALAAGVL